MTLLFRDLIYHFNDEENTKLFTRKFKTFSLLQTMSNCSPTLGCWCSSVHKGRSTSKDFTICTIVNHPKNIVSYVLGGVDHLHSTTCCKLAKGVSPFPRGQRSCTSWQVYCISSCWPGKLWITLLCSTNLDNKFGMNTVWHNIVNQIMKHVLFVCKHITSCKPKSFGGKSSYKLIIKSTLYLRWAKNKK